MAQQRTSLWEADLDEDFHDVDLNLAIGNYGQNGLYDDGTMARGTLFPKYVLKYNYSSPAPDRRGYFACGSATGCTTSSIGANP
jgi:hypothetical protein